MSTLERKYHVPSTLSEPGGRASRTTEDLHAWSIYRQNINSDIADHALRQAASSKSSTTGPFGEFRLQDSTINAILNHPRYGPGRERRDVLGPKYLEFGLPRVTVRKEGSSGYDSSDDGYYHLSKQRAARTRSDPDFRNHVISNPNGSLSHPQRSMDQLGGRRARSQMDLTSAVDGGGGYVPRGGTPSIKEDPRLLLEPPLDRLKQPHLQVRNLCFEVDKSALIDRLCGGARTKLRMLDNVSFEAMGGDVLAIMASTEEEGTAILDILANRHRKWLARVRGDFSINGLRTTPEQLASCVAHVPAELAFTRDMSVRQTLLFTSLLQEPSEPAANRDNKSRINALLQDLGLGDLMHTRIKELNAAELRKVAVACQLLLDTDILLLDQPSKDLDVFDTFFLVEYLRQWANRGRIVIMTLHPSTYEIFTMVSRVLLVSTGKVLYSGPRKDIISYFSYNNFPCPAFKNPADYYLDLVTVDTLSSDAMLESTQRVETLVQRYKDKPIPLTENVLPGLIPSTVKRAGFFKQLLALWIRVLIYQFPYNVIHMCCHVFLLGILSVALGAVFWNVRGGVEQEHIYDRMGFYHVLTSLAILPLLYMAITDVWEEKDVVANNVKGKLYTKGAYVINKLIYSLPLAGAVYLAYIIPAYTMAGLNILHPPTVGFRLYVGVLVLYLVALRAAAMAAGWACQTRGMAALLTTGLIGLLVAVAGYVVHLKGLGLPLGSLQWVSPPRWVAEFLVRREFSHPGTGQEPPKAHFICSRSPLLQATDPSVNVIRAATCGLQYDSDVLAFSHYTASTTTELSDLSLTLIVSASFLAFFVVVSFVCGLLSHPSKKKKT